MNYETTIATDGERTPEPSSAVLFDGDDMARRPAWRVWAVAGLVVAVFALAWWLKVAKPKKLPVAE